MPLLKRKKKRRNLSDFRSVLNCEDFLSESESSIEKALFWSSNFLSVPSAGKSLLNLKSNNERCVQERLNKMKVRVNVSGERFVIPYKTIRCYPDTLLATKEVEKYFDKQRKEYFFDRDSELFRYIFKFYKNDKIHYPMDECIQALIDEFRFFRIPLEIIKECCYAEFHAEFKNNSNCIKCAKQKRPCRNGTSADKSVEKKRNSVRGRVANLLTGASGGNEARAISHALLLCVVFNILGMILETLTCGSKKCGDLYRMEFFVFDSVCVVILSMEFLVTLAVEKNRQTYICSFKNLVYFGSLSPCYITWLLYVAIGIENIPVWVDDALKALRVFRLVKIAKASSHIRETVGQIVSAARGLSLALASCAIVIVVMSVLIYHLDSSFPHVPLAMWYLIVTITCVGYGDCVPSTAAGKVIASIGVILGILVLTLPVPIIQNKLGAKLDEEEPEPDEIVLDSLYPPDFADRQRRLSRMISLERRVSFMNKSADEQEMH